MINRKLWPQKKCLLKLITHQTKKLGKVFWDNWSVLITRQDCITPILILGAVVLTGHDFFCGIVKI